MGLTNAFVLFYFLKTNPTQHSVRGLRGLWLTPNIIACRSAKVLLYMCVWNVYLKKMSIWRPLEENAKEKLSQFCHVPARRLMSLHFFSLTSLPLLWECLLAWKKLFFLAANIVTLYDVSNIWHIPLLLRVSNILQN